MPLNPPPVISTGLGLISQPLKRSDQSREAIVTFAVLINTSPSLSAAQDTIDDFQTSFSTAFASMFDSEVTMLQPTIKLGDGTNVPFEAVAAGGSSNGSAAFAFPPPQVAFLVKKSTGKGGKSNRGRTYFPFALPSTTVSENGTVDPTELAGLNGILAAWLAQLNTDGTPMVIANKIYSSPSPPRHVTNIVDGPLVTSFVGEPLVATQRRRLGR